MCRKSENVACRASYCKVFSSHFLVREFFNTHSRLHSSSRAVGLGEILLPSIIGPHQPYSSNSLSSGASVGLSNSIR